jgi:hypothetical protein
VIRYFCHTDPSGPRADFAIRYAEAMIAIGETVRIIPVEFVQSGPRWAHLQHHLTTPIVPPYVNVVSTHPFWWGRLFTVGVKNVLITYETPESAFAMAQEVPASAKMAAGKKRNIVGGAHNDYEVFEIPPDRPDPRIVAARYAALVAPSEAIASAWQAWFDEIATHADDSQGDGGAICQVVVVGVDLAERAQTLRNVVAP